MRRIDTELSFLKDPAAFVTGNWRRRGGGRPGQRSEVGAA